MQGATDDLASLSRQQKAKERWHPATCQAWLRLPSCIQMPALFFKTGQKETGKGVGKLITHKHNIQDIHQWPPRSYKEQEVWNNNSLPLFLSLPRKCLLLEFSSILLGEENLEVVDLEIIESCQDAWAQTLAKAKRDLLGPFITRSICQGSCPQPTQVLVGIKRSTQKGNSQKRNGWR